MPSPAESQSERPRALVTGGARRLGRAMVLDLAAAGWDVAIHHLSSGAEALALAEELRARGVRVATLGADLLDAEETARLVPRAVEALGGRLSLLINNASIFENDDLATMTEESWRRGMESNLAAPVRLTRAFAEQAPPAERDEAGELRARAVVINMIDQRVWAPRPDFISYTVAKSGLLAFTRLAAQALAPHVRVAGIGPGPTLRAAGQSEAHFACQRAACPLGRGTNPEDVIAAMRFILACPAFTGQMIAVDAGQHLAWESDGAATPG